MRTISAVMALALISLGATPAPTPSPTPAPSDPRASVDALFKDYDRTEAPGCALGVYRDGKILYARGYGMANLELSAAITPQTVFDIGSTSKQFTAFCDPPAGPRRKALARRRHPQVGAGDPGLR
jgi:CubicO group peptidase (beta-lactamase class C family)